MYERTTQRTAARDELQGAHEPAAPGRFDPSSRRRNYLQSVQRQAAGPLPPAADVSDLVGGGPALTLSLPFQATVQRAVRDADGEDGGVATTAEGAAPQAAPPGPEPQPQVPQQGPEEAGTPLFIAQLPGPAAEDSGEADSIASALSINHDIARGLTVPNSDFGLTSSTLRRFRDVKITPGKGSFAVSAIADYKIRWDTWAGDGPSGQKNITSDADANITKDNYSNVTDDLRPNARNRPRRRDFWAKDLTENHELFHVGERKSFSTTGMANAQTNLNGRTASKAEDIVPMLQEVWQTEVSEFIATNMANPGKEDRAYADGAASYKARADAIKANGDAGKYK